MDPLFFALIMLFTAIVIRLVPVRCDHPECVSAHDVHQTKERLAHIQERIKENHDRFHIRPEADCVYCDRAMRS